MNINKLLAKIVFDLPVFGYFLFQLDVVENKDIPTCAVSSNKLYYNQSFLDSLKEEEALGVLLHEVVHAMFMHPSELDKALSANKDNNVWTVALEMVTNAEVFKIIEAFSLPYKLPGEPYSPLSNKIPPATMTYLYDRTYADMDSINLYYKLLGEAPPTIRKIGSAIICGQEKDEALINIDRIIPSPLDNQRPNILKLQEVANAIKKKGRNAGELERLIKNLTNNNVPWERILYNYVNQIIGADETSYNARNFRHPYWEEVIIPGLVDNAVDIIVAIDTSGSVSANELKFFVSSIKGLYFYTDRIKIVAVDAEVKNIKEVTESELSSIALKGGGGTDFTDFFKKFDGKSQIIIFFTDGYATYPQNPPAHSEVLWVLTKSNQKPPFGKVVYVEN